MALNTTSNGVPENIGFGPAVVLYGVVGATPTVDIGFVGEEGANAEITTEMGRVVQGNPKTLIKVFNMANQAIFSVSGIEWNFENYARSLNAGETTASASEETFEWGGDPCPTEISLQFQHQRCDGTTMNINVWRAVGQGNLTLAIGHDLHNFPFSWEAMQASNRWDGSATDLTGQLFQLQHVLT